MNDYRRPAEYQIDRIYKCQKCGDEQSVRFGESAVMPCYHCKGFVTFSGESYPHSSEWDEERDNVNDSFHNRNRY